jgi:hypothetical protein
MTVPFGFMPRVAGAANGFNLCFVFPRGGIALENAKTLLLGGSLHNR